MEWLYNSFQQILWWTYDIEIFREGDVLLNSNYSLLSDFVFLQSSYEYANNLFLAITTHILNVLKLSNLWEKNDNYYIIKNCCCIY